jgi:hypothetical protein
MKRLVIKLLVVAVMMFAATSAFADYSYTFNVDTSSVNGASGYIDLQFNPGISSTGAASAAVSNFISDASLGAASTMGGVTGVLPSTVTINNTTGYNDYFQAVTFGNNLNYSLNLIGAPGSSFGLSFYGIDGATPLFTTDPNGYATVIDVNSNGAVLTNNSSQVNVTPTPIPAAVWLFGSGLAGMFGIRRKAINI